MSSEIIIALLNLVGTLVGVDVGSAAYFRLNCAEISGDSIITVNEEIT